MELTTCEKKRFFVRINRNLKRQLKDLLPGKENVSFGAKGSAKMKASYVMKEESSSLSERLIETKDIPTFSKLVKEHMYKKNITSSDIYKNSLIDRKLFSALNVNDNYMPSKETAIMYCLALNLQLDEAMELLSSAGYTLYKYSNFDIIVKYFLENKIYNIDKLNDALYVYTKKCIGYR